MSRGRGPNINERIVDIFITLINSCDGKVEWDDLCIAANPLIGHIYKRQAIAKNIEIFEARRIHNNNLTAASKVPNLPDAEQDPELYMLCQENARLVAENSRLKAQNDAYIEKFTIWAYNASIRGLSGEYLNSALTKVDREQTRDSKKK